MFKYMKYEIKGTYRFILGIILLVLLATSMIQLTIFNGINTENPGFLGDTFFPILMIITTFIIIGATISLLVYIVSSFRKELFEDRGYLTFSLPISGKEILGSKLLISLLYLTVYGVVIFAYNFILGIILFYNDLGKYREAILEQMGYIVSFVGDIIVSVGTSALISTIVTLLLVYLAISLSKVTLRNRKIGGLWFIIYLFLNSLYGYISFKIATIFPYGLSLADYKIYNLNEIMVNWSQYSQGGMFTIGDGLVSYISIASVIFSLASVIGIFALTSYLLEKKIDL